MSYIDDIFHMCKLVPRVAYHLVAVSKSEANYFDVVTTHRELRNMKGKCFLCKRTHSIWKASFLKKSFV